MSLFCQGQVQETNTLISNFLYGKLVHYYLNLCLQFSALDEFRGVVLVLDIRRDVRMMCNV